MSLRGLCTPRLALTVAGCSVLLAIGGPSATADPATDSQGFVDSTARCTTPDVAAAFGSTKSSRIAICKTPSAQYQYRGVRLSDGAKLVCSATRSSDGTFVAENDGITYKVTSSSLVVSTGQQILREEPMVYFNGPQTSNAPAESPKPAAPTTSTTPAKPLPPPLPAEVGGQRH